MDLALAGADLRCGVCGNSLRALARFCDACGALVGSAQSAGEHKQITVLFADVVESMKLAAALDSERLHEVMTDLLNRSAAVVQRYRGTVDKFTGDGLMALFGAPLALEDHALRACIAALEIQSSAKSLADEVRQRDNVELRVRIGLNSGEVVAGDVGAGPGSYTAVGHAVGLAQRMESAAAPGTVLCSETTVRLASQWAVFGPVQRIAVKGADELVAARRLDRVDSDRPVLGRDSSPLIGRDAELAELLGAFHSGRVSVAGVVGEPGVGKSRLVRELADAADGDVIATRCESHAASIPLHALSRLLRAIFGIRGLARQAARESIGDQLRHLGGYPGDREVVFDLLSISEPETTAASMTADSRRNQIVDLMRRVAGSRQGRSLFIVDDMHWVDPASEEVFASFAESLSAEHATFVCGFRPEYQGPLRQISAPTIMLAPLSATATATLAAELVGRHPTVEGVAERIAARAAGNPLFVEEIVRDLAGRGLLKGNRSDYRLVGSLDSIAVPSTIQSVLAARIDRLTNDEKAILNAAAVIGSSFSIDMLRALLPGVDPEQMHGLISAELIDQTAHLPIARYMFRHPLVRAVAYDSQLSATRADSHRRLATAIERRDPSAAEQNSALIAQHLEAAGDLAESHKWYMRSGGWLAQRDIRGAHDCWKRARAVADILPPGNSDVTAMRIAPRAQIALTEWMVGGDSSSQRNVDELRLLIEQSGDPLPLALGIAGRLTSLIIHESRVRDAVVMAAELKGLYERIGGTASDRAEVLMAIAYAHYEAGELSESRAVGERLLAIGSDLQVHDLAPAMALVGAVKCLTGLGEQGRRDIAHAQRLVRDDGDAFIGAIVLGYQMDPVLLGFELVDPALLNVAADAVRMAESLGDAYALALARYAYGIALFYGEEAGHTEGMRLLELSRADGIDIGGSNLDADIAAESMRHGVADDERIATALHAVEFELKNGDVLFAGHAVATLVRVLADRRAPGDLDYAHKIAAQLEVELAHVAEPALKLWPLRCRTELARASGDRLAYSSALRRYRDLAERLRATGHCAAADQLAR